MRSFAELFAEAKRTGPRRVALAGAADMESLEALAHAQGEGLVHPVLVGAAAKVGPLAEQAGLLEPELVDEPDLMLAAERAVRMVAAQEADLVMKGQIGTAEILRAVLNKDWGLRTDGTLSHVAIIELPGYDRWILMSDGGVNIAPDLQRKAAITQNAIATALHLGIERPRVAILAGVEKVNPDMRSTVDAALIAKMGERGQIKGGVVDGPLALDTAVDPACAALKGLGGPVAGQADVLVVPDVEAGNILYKTLVFMAKTAVATAGVIVGARAPVVLLSRSDARDAKLRSLAFGVFLAGRPHIHRGAMHGEE